MNNILFKFFKRFILTGFLLLSGAISGCANANDAFPLATDLQKTAEVAAKKNVPVVIFYTASWCHYCHILERDILDPLLAGTDIENYAEFRKVSISESRRSMVDFAGNNLNMGKFAENQDVEYTPTTLVYDHKGQIIADPILGITLEEFYPANLEKAINTGLQKLGSSKRLDIYKMMDTK